MKADFHSLQMLTQNFGVSWSTKPPFRRALHCSRQRVFLKTLNPASNKLAPAIFPEFHCVALSIIYTFHLTTFLANDATLVTSYGYCQSLKINDIRDTSVLRSVRLGGYSVRRWVRVCTGSMKPLPYHRHIPLQFILWENARALKCFASASFD